MTQTSSLTHQAAQYLQEVQALNKLDKKNLEQLFDAYKTPTIAQTQVLDKRTAAAYFIARGLSIAGVIRKILAENHAFFNNTESIIDFGGGPGTFLWEYLELFTPPQYTNIDTSNGFLSIFQDLCKYFEQPNSVHSMRQNYFSYKTDKTYDLGVMSYTLCENVHSIELVQRASEYCDQILIIEPGTPLGYQNILQARELLLNNKFSILAPCTTQGTCPMATHEDDWCHFMARIERTKYQMFLKSAQKSYEDEKYIYLLASKSQKAEHKDVRLISRPKIHPHGAQVFFCSEGNENIQTTTVHKKSHKNLYKHIKKATRGDLIQIPEQE